MKFLLIGIYFFILDAGLKTSATFHPKKKDQHQLPNIFEDLIEKIEKRKLEHKKKLLDKLQKFHPTTTRRPPKSTPSPYHSSQSQPTFDPPPPYFDPYYNQPPPDDVTYYPITSVNYPQKLPNNVPLYPSHSQYPPSNPDFSYASTPPKNIPSKSDPSYSQNYQSPYQPDPSQQDFSPPSHTTNYIPPKTQPSQSPHYVPSHQSYTQNSVPGITPIPPKHVPSNTQTSYSQNNEAYPIWGFVSSQTHNQPDREYYTNSVPATGHQEYQNTYKPGSYQVTNDLNSPEVNGEGKLDIKRVGLKE